MYMSSDRESTNALARASARAFNFVSESAKKRVRDQQRKHHDNIHICTLRDYLHVCIPYDNTHMYIWCDTVRIQLYLKRPYLMYDHVYTEEHILTWSSTKAFTIPVRARDMALYMHTNTHMN